MANKRYIPQAICSSVTATPLRYEVTAVISAALLRTLMWLVQSGNPSLVSLETLEFS